MDLMEVGVVDSVTVREAAVLSVPPIDMEPDSVTVAVTQTVPDPVPVWLIETEDEADPDPDTVCESCGL